MSSSTIRPEKVDGMPSPRPTPIQRPGPDTVRTLAPGVCPFKMVPHCPSACDRFGCIHSEPQPLAKLVAASDPLPSGRVEEDQAQQEEHIEEEEQKDNGNQDQDEGYYVQQPQHSPFEQTTARILSELRHPPYSDSLRIFMRQKPGERIYGTIKCEFRYLNPDDYSHDVQGTFDIHVAQYLHDPYEPGLTEAFQTIHSELYRWIVQKTTGSLYRTAVPVESLRDERYAVRDWEMDVTLSLYADSVKFEYIRSVAFDRWDPMGTELWSKRMAYSMLPSTSPSALDRRFLSRESLDWEEACVSRCSIWHEDWD